MSKKTINKSHWSDDQILAAKEIWKEYEDTHDLTDRKGEAAGIDPASGEVWIGEDIVAIGEARRQQGLTSPLFFVRIGYPTYYRKGGRR